MNIADTIKILKRLRNVQAEYPTHLLEPRRDEFFKQMAAIRIDMKVDQTGQANAQSPSTSSSFLGAPAGVVEQVLQYALIGTFVAVSALGMYTYWDEIRDFFSPNAADVQVVPEWSPSPVPSDEVIFTDTPTLSPTPVEPMFGFTATPSRSNPGPGTENTPVPEDTPVPTKTQPGLHLGQTKTPKPKD